ncbi:MAG: AEC family transporter [Aliishimia sp.]
MNLAVTVLEIVAPVFLLAGIGFVWVKFGLEYRIEFVTRLVMSLALPALIFVSLMQTKVDPAALTALSFATLVAYALITLGAYVLVRVMDLETRTFLTPTIFGNTGNLGLPLAFFAFGQEGLSYAIVVFALMSMWFFTFGIWIFSGGGSVIKVVKEPLVGATLLGALFLWQGWETPEFLTNTLSLLGQMVIPIMLITLGVAVARLTPGGVVQAVWLSILRLVVCASIAWAVGVWFELDKVAFGILVLQAATPVAVTSYLLAEKYGGDADAVAGLVVVSTLISVGTLPLLLALLL